MSTSALHFCSVPNRINTKCQVLGDGHLKIDGIEQGITETAAGNLAARERYYRVNALILWPMARRSTPKWQWRSVNVAVILASE